jgi:hypothetical protein
MNKIHVTKKQMRDNYHILGVSYCKLQFLLNYTSPVAYSTGVYGWACDYYDIDGVIISMGYNPIKSKNIRASYEIIRRYDDAARLILSNSSNYEKNKEAVKILLSEFINEVRQ